MKKTFQTFLMAAAVMGLSAGTVMAADEMNTPNSPQAGMESQSSVSADTGISANAAGAAQVEEVQASLKSEGYAVTVDGVWGPQTADALRQFQQANNLDASGSLNAETLAALNVDNAPDANTSMGESRSW